MKTQTKVLIGVGIAAVATTLIAIGVIRELKAIRNLTIDADELPEDLIEDGDLEAAIEADEEAGEAAEIAE